MIIFYNDKEHNVQTTRVIKVAHNSLHLSTFNIMLLGMMFRMYMYWYEGDDNNKIETHSIRRGKLLVRFNPIGMHRKNIIRLVCENVVFIYFIRNIHFTLFCTKLVVLLLSLWGYIYTNTYKYKLMNILCKNSLTFVFLHQCHLSLS